MNGWSKDFRWLDEINNAVTCVHCRDPHGARLLSSTHTYDEGCMEYWEVLRIVRERYKQ